ADFDLKPTTDRLFTPPSLSLCRPKGLFGLKIKEKDCIFLFSRGLRHHRYDCVALRGLILESLFLKNPLNPKILKSSFLKSNPKILVSKTKSA
ncbi:MAG TPA: hypothetical protein P5518_05090, partial [Candidatus Cloacimonas sp.]|nr:hypothetical protein [Candidatus Cloacimonas sp.]